MDNMSRRRLLALSLMAPVAACTGSEGVQKQAGPSPGAKGGGATKSPERLVQALESQPSTLDPAAIESAFGKIGGVAVFATYERLVEISPKRPEVSPALATKVPSLDNGLISSDGRTYTFSIRDGVVFHDGSELTAHDVLFSWQRLMEMNIPGNAAADSMKKWLAEMRVVDDHTFEVSLKEPYWPFLTSIAASMGASVVSKKAVETHGGVQQGKVNEYVRTHTIGSGPYRLAEWNRGQNLQFDIFEDYWGERPDLNVTWAVVGKANIRVLGLKGGKYDLIGTDPTFVKDLQKAPDLTVFTDGLTVEPVHIAFNLRIPEGGLPAEDTIPPDFFWDTRVRQAFNYAFNYEAFLQNALHGIGTLCPHYVPKGVPGYDPEAPVYHRNLAKAKELFKKSGWWDRGFTASIITEDYIVFRTAALVLKDSLEGLNPKFRIRVVAMPETQYDEYVTKDPIPIAMYARNGGPFPTANGYLRQFVHPDGYWGNRLGFRNGYDNADHIASLIEKASRTLEPEARAAMYSEVQRLAYNDPMWIIAAQEGAAMAYRDWVQGFNYSPLWPHHNPDWARMWSKD